MNKQELIEKLEDFPDDIDFDSFLFVATGTDNGENLFFSRRENTYERFYEWTGWLQTEIFNMQSNLRLTNERDRLNDLIGEV